MLLSQILALMSQTKLLEPTTLQCAGEKRVVENIGSRIGPMAQ